MVDWHVSNHCVKNSFKISIKCKMCRIRDMQKTQNMQNMHNIHNVKSNTRSSVTAVLLQHRHKGTVELFHSSISLGFDL